MTRRPVAAAVWGNPVVGWFVEDARRKVWASTGKAGSCASSGSGGDPSYTNDADGEVIG